MNASSDEQLPGPGENYNPGQPTQPRQAATVILLRGGEQALEVLLVKRTPKARFMGGVWVFPGGAVDDGEGEGDDAHRAAAIRELREEAAIALEDPAALVKFSRWITPAEVQIALRHALLPRRAARRPGGPDRRRGVRRSAAGSRPRPRSTPTATGSIALVFPDDQAPRTAGQRSPP